MAILVSTEFNDAELLRRETGNCQKKIRSLSLAYDSMDDTAFKVVMEILIESINFVEILRQASGASGPLWTAEVASERKLK